jgi:hypothetical protein
MATPRMRRVLAREAHINRRRAWVVGTGILVGLASAPLMAQLNPGGLIGLAIHIGVLTPVFLCVVGQLSPYDECWHEFHDTYVNAGHQYAWPFYVLYHGTVGEGLTNFMIVEFGLATTCALMVLVTGGAFEIGCVFIAGLAGIVSWFLSSCLKLHWY